MLLLVWCAVCVMRTGHNRIPILWGSWGSEGGSLGRRVRLCCEPTRDGLLAEREGGTSAGLCAAKRGICLATLDVAPMMTDLGEG